MAMGLKRGLGGLSLWDERVIETASKVNLEGFMKYNIDKDVELLYAGMLTRVWRPISQCFYVRNLEKRARTLNKCIR